MSWLTRLLGPGDDAPAPVAGIRRRVEVVPHGERIVTIPQLDVVGQSFASPGGRYILVWQDRGWGGDAADRRGRYLLLDEGMVAVDARMDRPQDGKVADDGTFILNDWGARDQLSGTFHAFRADGSPILARRYAANLLNNGLSPDGRLAACQTCNSPGSPDSSVFTIFDLAAGTERARWAPESGWAQAYAFPESGDRVRMLRGDRSALDYSLDGEFLDRRLWLEDEIASGTLYVIRIALAEGEAKTGLPLEALRAGARRSLADDDERFRAEAWRLLGEIEEAAGQAAAAIEAYERALALNPRIGIARRVSALRKTSAA